MYPLTRLRGRLSAQSYLRVSVKGQSSWSDAGDEHENGAAAKALAVGSHVAVSGGKRKSAQDSRTADVALARPREEEVISLRERYWDLGGSFVDH